NAGAVLTLLLPVLASGMLWAGVNEWTNIGPEGGFVRLVVDPQDPTTFYAIGNGVFQSKDGAASWSTAGLMGREIRNLVIDPQNRSTVYALAGGDPDEDSPTTIFKSTDGGANWSEAGSAPPDCCAIFAVDADGMLKLYSFAGIPPRDLWKSTDGGTSWAHTSGLPNRFYFVALAIDPLNPGTLYAAAHGQDSALYPVMAVFK